MKIVFLAVFTLCILHTIHAQPELDIKPNKIEFEDIFSRLESVSFINKGDQPLRIDSITYKFDYYYIRFDSYWRLPYTIEPDDTVKMDCILAGYYYVPSSDTLDTMMVYSNSINGVEDLRIEIDYFDDDYENGYVNGKISESSIEVDQANVYFFYEGTYLVSSVQTDQFGNYNAALPPGQYIIAAEKDSFYLTYYGQVFDPYNSAFVTVMEDSVVTADIDLTRMTNTGISISGKIIDSLANSPLKKGVVVIRKQTHTPGKISSSKFNSPLLEGTYTTFIRSDGTYEVKNIIEPDYYYIQSFSDYFLPAYFNEENQQIVSWHQADSVFVNSPLTDMNINMPRDSSFGGGQAFGQVVFPEMMDSIYSGVLILAKSIPNNYLFNYGLTRNDGSFKVNFLPYGTYQLIAQKIGYEDALSGIITIDSLHTDTTGINILFSPLSVYDENIYPDNPELYQNYPNPFNPYTRIDFYLPGGSNILLRVTNILGEEVAVLRNGFVHQGNHSVIFSGNDLSSGTYFVSLISGQYQLTRKILLLK